MPTGGRFDSGFLRSMPYLAPGLGPVADGLSPNRPKSPNRPYRAGLPTAPSRPRNPASQRYWKTLVLICDGPRRKVAQRQANSPTLQRQGPRARGVKAPERVIGSRVRPKPTELQTPVRANRLLKCRNSRDRLGDPSHATHALNASPAAAMVFAMSSSVCAAEIKPASNCDGAR
jgi:hypothetical protein